MLGFHQRRCIYQVRYDWPLVGETCILNLDYDVIGWAKAKSERGTLISFVLSFYCFTIVFKKILAMFTIGFAYYPLFACMATNYKITGYVIGVLYSAFWWEIFFCLLHADSLVRSHFCGCRSTRLQAPLCWVTFRKIVAKETRVQTSSIFFLAGGSLP